MCRWLGLVGQIRPKKLISAIKADVQGAKEWDLPVFKKIAKRFVDKSPYSIGLTSQLALSPSSSVLLSTERHGDGEGRRDRAMLFHQACISTLKLITIFFIIVLPSLLISLFLSLFFK